MPRFYPGTTVPKRNVNRSQRGALTGSAAGSWAEVTLAANVAFFSRLTVEEETRVSSIAFFVSTIDAGNPATDVGLYDRFGNLITSTGAQTGIINAGVVKAVTLPITVVLDPDEVYYPAISSASAGVGKIFGLTGVNANAHALFGATFPNVEGGQMAAAHPLPAALTVALTTPLPVFAART